MLSSSSHTSRLPDAADPVRRRFRAHPSALAQVRRFVREITTRPGIPGGIVDDLVLAASEAASNAMVHTNSSHIEVFVTVAAARVDVRVQDQGVFRRRVAMPEIDGHGRGFPLMMAVMDEVSVKEGTENSPGTLVRLSKVLDDPAVQPIRAV